MTGNAATSRKSPPASEVWKKRPNAALPSNGMGPGAVREAAVGDSVGGAAAADPAAPATAIDQGVAAVPAAGPANPSPKIYFPMCAAW